MDASDSHSAASWKPRFLVERADDLGGHLTAPLCLGAILVHSTRHGRPPTQLGAQCSGSVSVSSEKETKDEKQAQHFGQWQM